MSDFFTNFPDFSKIPTINTKSVVWECANQMSKSYSTSSIIKVSSVLAHMKSNLYNLPTMTAPTIVSEALRKQINALDYSISPKLEILEASNLRFEKLMSILDENNIVNKVIYNTETEHESDDYVVIPESTIREYEIPDTLTLSLGDNKVRISTSLFVSIIGILISIIISLANVNTDQNKQTKILQRLLESVDTTNSSQKEYFEDIRSAVQFQDESLESNQQSTGNMTESPNIESEN